MNSIMRTIAPIAGIFLFWINGSTAEINDELTADLSKRRHLVMDRMDKEDFLILFSGEPKNFSNDVFYPFRQENNLYYLTGINQKGITLVLIPDNTEQREILFIPKRIPSQEIWTGHMLSREEARNISGIDHVWYAEEFEPFIDAVLTKKTYASEQASDPGDYQTFFQAIDQGTASIRLLLDNQPGLRGPIDQEHQFAKTLRERFPKIRLRDAFPIFRDLRMIKSDYEIQQLRQAVAITCEAHIKVMKAVEPGIFESHLDGIIHATYRQHGATWGFPSIVGSGPNATTLHYEENARQMHDGELVLLDIGAEVGHYSADVTRTIPVNGRFSQAQRDIYNLVLNAQQEAIKIIRPGITIVEVHQTARDLIKKGLKRLSLITDTTGNQYRMWFMHGTSHWIGLDVHDAGTRNKPFQPGMMLTVEPGIYIRSDALDYLEDTPENQSLIASIRPAFEKYMNIGVRIEDDIMVTDDGYEIISKTAPITVEDIEQMMEDK